MVALDIVRASNSRLRSLPAGLVAVFAGATSGIGEQTLKQFCRHTIKPRVYFVGRSQDAADRIISEVKAIQPETQMSFIKKDLTLLKNVDEVCDEIKAKETKLNLLFMTQGTMSLKGRDETTEGLDRKMMTSYYSRMRFTQQLLPLLHAASPSLSRVLSVLSPGEEFASFDLDNLDLKKNFSLWNAANHTITMTDFAFEEMAKANPTVSFVHAFPGGVKTGYVKEANFVIRGMMNVVATVGSRWMMPLEESGERHLYAATSERYAAKYRKEAGVPVNDDFGENMVMKGSDGQDFSGAYLVGSDGEFRANVKVLKVLRDKNAGPKVWEHTMKTFESVRG